VGSRRALRGRFCRRLLRAGRDRGTAPVVADAAQEVLAFRRAQPGHRLLRIERGSTLKMSIETHQGHVPTDAHGARPVLSPASIVDVGDVLELEVRAAVCVLGEIDLDPAHLPYELPRHPTIA